eukprot:11393452-Heterocapsa_arctica.AAC.1
MGGNHLNIRSASACDRSTASSCASDRKPASQSGSRSHSGNAAKGWWVAAASAKTRASWSRKVELPYPWSARAGGERVYSGPLATGRRAETRGRGR